MHRFDNITSSCRFLLEHIGQAFIGEEVPVNTAFNDYALARCQRITGEIDHVVVKWNPELYLPVVTFDPNCGKGVITQILGLFIYSRAESQPKPEAPKPRKIRFTKSPESMTGRELFFELESIHGLTKEHVNQYKGMDARIAKVKEMRSLALKEDNDE